MKPYDMTYWRCPRCGRYVLEPEQGGFRCTACGERFEFQTGAVALTRARDFVGVAASIKVLLEEDEHELGTIPYGGRRVFHLPAGIHSLSVGMDWCRSPPYVVEVRPGELVELEGSVRWRGFLWCWGLIASFIMPERMFVIRPLEGCEAVSRLRELWEGICVFGPFLALLGLGVLALLFLL